MPALRENQQGFGSLMRGTAIGMPQIRCAEKRISPANSR
jgi:hypothetical protein